MQLVEAPSETLHTSTVENSIQETIVTLSSRSSKEDASFGNSTAYVGEINCLNLVRKESCNVSGGKIGQKRIHLLQYLVTR